MTAVEAVRIHALSVPLPQPIRTSIHLIKSVDTVVVELLSDGATGVGYCFAFGPHRARALRALVDDLVPLYQGQPPSAAAALYEQAWRSINFLGHAGAAVIALSALDTACWDLAARQAGLPLVRYLGGARMAIPTYASSGLWLGSSLDELIAEARGFLAQGHRAMKMRLGRGPREDVERARRLREVLGPDVKLLADVNQGWDEPTALRVGHELEGVELFWLEEPLAYEDLAGHARVAAALRTPVASGETEYGPLGMRRYLEIRAADVLMPDLQRMGGVTGFRKAAALCEAFHTPLSSHLFVEPSAHLLAADGNALILEHMSWWDALFDEPYAIRDGQVVLPDRPGLGVGLRPRAVQQYRA